MKNYSLPFSFKLITCILLSSFVLHSSSDAKQCRLPSNPTSTTCTATVTPFPSPPLGTPLPTPTPPVSSPTPTTTPTATPAPSSTPAPSCSCPPVATSCLGSGVLTDFGDRGYKCTTLPSGVSMAVMASPASSATMQCRVKGCMPAPSPSPPPGTGGGGSGDCWYQISFTGQHVNGAERRGELVRINSGSLPSCAVNALTTWNNNNNGLWNSTPSTVTIYMSNDGNCTIPMMGSNPTVCAGSSASASGVVTPISLNWLSENNIYSSAIKYSKFPLILGKENTDSIYEWKASNKLPLLVYGKAGNGKVTSASQLFGNYTFGKEWKNGYEALASLDINFDGKLTGNELNSIGLWFDNNQDGVSHSGEVKNLKDVQVITLFYKPSFSDIKSKDIYASIGYERIINGKNVLGSSVDWISHEVNNKAQMNSTKFIPLIGYIPNYLN